MTLADIVDPSTTAKFLETLKLLTHSYRELTEYRLFIASELTHSLDNRLLLVLFEIVDDLDGIKQVQDMESRFVEWDKLLSPKLVIFVLAAVAAVY